MKLLILRLEGMLQSWGERSRWDRRDTADFPTKSSVVGLLGCAMGLPRGDERLAALAAEITMAVRADRPGSVMTDFHTVQGRVAPLPNAKGGTHGETIITPRSYLEDACFTVFLAGPGEVLAACAEALRHPRWVPSLGRQSCPPTYPLLPVLCDTYDTLEDAVRSFTWPEPTVRELSYPLLYEIEDARGLRTRCDQPVDASRSRYAIRRVHPGTVQKEEPLCT